MIKELKNKWNELYFGIIIFLFIAGYTFFFTSSYWMPQSSDAKAFTHLGEAQEWEAREVSVIRWDYSEEQELMEVELDITNKAYDGINKYKYSAITKSGEQLEVKAVVEEDNWVILHLSNVPERFREISLRMDMDDYSDDTLKLYTNVNKVSKVSKIEEKSVQEYKLLKLENQKKLCEKEIKALEKKISDSNNKVKNIESEIERLEGLKAYQTSKEQENTDYAINEANSQIEIEKGLVEDYGSQIQEFREKIKILDEEIANVK
jgi:hypothetical protein